jgi:hypothetical protein
MSFPTDLGPVPMVPQFSYYHLTAVGVFGITDFLSRLSRVLLIVRHYTSCLYYLLAVC